MLSADLVIAQTRKQQLLLPDLSGKAGESVRYWAEQIIDAAQGCIGLPRQEFGALVQVMGETQQVRKMTRGLAKILEDACEFEQADPEIAADLRRKLFSYATEVRRQLRADSRWDRAECVERVCSENGWDVATLEQRLYADLPGAQRLLNVPKWSSQQLFERYDQARVQAVLLRAVQVRVRYTRTSVPGLREVLRQIKFRQLLHQSQTDTDSGLQLTIDGPMSLFESASKYGLQLALLLPSLVAAGPFELEADVRWGKVRSELRFAYKSKTGAPAPRATEEPQSPVADDLSDLLSEIRQYPGPFEVRPAAALIDLPGIGICVPDLTFSHRGHPERRVHLEMLGYWSREAVWRRVELAEAGLPEPMVFGVNQRLRVSEEVLSRSLPAALYVFRGRPNAIAILERVAEVARRRWSDS